jgi:hypothetical protein
MTKATITIQAPADHPDVLEIRDAMSQVLDFFELLTAEEDRDTIAWNLTFAGTNSPFTAEAEAVSKLDGIDIRAIASTRVAEASEYFSALSNGEVPRSVISTRRRSAAQRLLRRNTGSVGKTTVVFDGATKPAPVILTPSVSAIALENAAKEESAGLMYLPSNRERSETGSVEGVLIDVGTDYNQPAIRIIERKSGREIACRVEPSVIEEIATSVTFKDVWEHRRIVVRGRILFDENGVIVRIFARSIRPVSPRIMTLKDIEDKNFTDGLGVLDYIDRLREGELG